MNMYPNPNLCYKSWHTRVCSPSADGKGGRNAGWVGLRRRLDLRMGMLSAVHAASI